LDLILRAWCQVQPEPVAWATDTGGWWDTCSATNLTSKEYHREKKQYDGSSFKGIFQPFELGGVTRLIRSAVKFWKAGNLKHFFLMIQTHERSLKQMSAA
jgi:hypothetical protein